MTNIADSIILEPGKIYYIDYGEQTQLVARFLKEETTKYKFFTYIHYWNGFETFYQGGGGCVKSGIKTIRRASDSEKWALVKEEIAKGAI